MKNTVFRTSLKTLALAMLLIAALAGPSFAADVYLVAQEFQMDVGGDLITMWGFAPADAGFNPTDVPSVPGPMITGVPEGDTLNIHVQNNLTTDISVVIPGLPTTLSPFRDVDGRVKSFTARTAPGGNTTYTWTNVRPGSYIYQSGTHPAVQVQMGLIGGLIVQPTLGADHVYNDAATQFGNEITLFFHEIDPVLHAAVANGDYGTPIYPSTIHYAPKYFLINGGLGVSPGDGIGPLTSGLAVVPNPTYGATSVTLTGTAQDLPGGFFGGMLSTLNLTAGQPTALRFFNGGLEDDVPTLDGGLYMNLLGEYGSPYPYPKTQYSVLLPAGKTIDAIVTAETTDTYALYDRRLNLASSSRLAASNVIAAEWWTGADPGAGAGTPMTAADGLFDSDLEALTASIDVSTWAPGALHTIHVRSQDLAGNWGPADATTVTVMMTDKIGVYRDGLWFLDTNGDRALDVSDETFDFGVTGLTSIVGDWSGDGVDDVGAFINKIWFLDMDGSRSNTAGDQVFVFGTPGVTPIVGDWNGDGVDNMGLFLNATFLLDTNGNHAFDAGDDMFVFGVAGDRPIVGDWNGDGSDEIGIHRPGTWSLDLNGDQVYGAGDVSFAYGFPTDTPVVGDWNGDGSDEIGIFRDGTWALDVNGDYVFGAGDVQFDYGTAGDKPVVGSW